MDGNRLNSFSHNAKQGMKPRSLVAAEQRYDVIPVHALPPKLGLSNFHISDFPVYYYYPSFSSVTIQVVRWEAKEPPFLFDKHGRRIFYLSM